MTDYAARRPPRSHHAVPGREKLPPIPERGRSSPQRARVLGGRATERAGAGAAVPPAPESWRGAPPTSVAAVESRDDDADVPPASAPAVTAVLPTPQEAKNTAVATARAGDFREDAAPLDPSMVPENEKAATTVMEARPRLVFEDTVVASHAASISSEALLSPSGIRARNASARANIPTRANNLADAAPPFPRKVHRERSTAQATAHAPELRQEESRRARGEAADGSSSNGSAHDPLELLSIPSDEIIVAAAKKSPDGDGPRVAEEGQPPRCGHGASRDTRDQYQLGRLQVRLSRRREMPRVVTNEEESPNYKTLRSSRIKAQAYSNRTMNHPTTNESQPQTHGSIANSKSLSIANNASSTTPSLSHGNTGSTIPSLSHGKTLGHSRTSSSFSPSLSHGKTLGPWHSQTSSSFSHPSVVPSGSHASGGPPSAASPELSEYRGKVFAKMLRLFHDLSPTPATLRDDDTISNITNIKERVVDEEVRASCGSEAELRLIQKLTEEEMSRILHEFEQSNSLVERKGTAAAGRSAAAPPPAAVPRAAAPDAVPSFPMPEKIAYDAHDSSRSIASKFSDVTSPTCSEGFEPDEVLATPPRPRLLPPAGSHSPRPRGGPQSRRASPLRSPLPLPPAPSPAAAAAAAVAAAMASSAAEKGDAGRESPPPQQLACVLEMSDTVEVNADTDNAQASNPKGDLDAEASNPEGDLPLVKRMDEGIEDSIKETAKVKDDPQDMDNPLAFAEEVDAPRATKSAKQEAPQEYVLTGIDQHVDGPGDEDVGGKTEEVLASTREKARRTDDEEHFRDGIMNAVAKAATSAASVRLGEHDAELQMVTSILSQYEEASQKVKEGGRTAKAPVDVIVIMEEPVPSKRVTFLEPLAPSNEGSSVDALCGCVIQ